MTILFICAALLFTAAAVWLYLRVRKRLPARGRALFRVVAVLALAVLISLAWASAYYHAAPEAAAALSSDAAVTVTRTENGWRFDGPGDRVLIFYPGAKVEAAAYAPLMHSLAAGGVDTCLVEMPLKIALLNINAADRFVKSDPAEEWYIGGHSLGGAAAALYAKAHPEAVNGLVLLAAYASAPLPEGLRVLSIYGGRDGVLNMKKYDESRPNLPPGTEELVLADGNHAGFGCYGPQRGDGEPGIPAAEQQADTARAILDWIGE